MHLPEDDASEIATHVAAIERFQKQHETHLRAAEECQTLARLLQEGLSLHLSKRYNLEGDGWHLDLAARELVRREH